MISHGADVNQQITGPNSTPLISICSPRPSGTRNRQENLERQDCLVRELVHQGADIAAEHGFIVYNPLSAACLGTGVSIINYLLYKGASPQLRDPLGRLAIHFAAANGLENFEAIHHADPNLLMAPDTGNKIPLHWAAQFGRVRTVEAILNYVSLPTERRRYVNEADTDGWTPLCWALRPTELLWDPNMPSEPANYAETVRFLLENGADVTLRCRMGSEQDLYTAFQLALLHDAGDEVIELLQESLDSNVSDSQEVSSQVYTRPYGYFCGICFSVSNCKNPSAIPLEASGYANPAVSSPQVYLWDCLRLYHLSELLGLSKVLRSNRHLPRRPAGPRTESACTQVPIMGQQGARIPGHVHAGILT